MISDVKTAIINQLGELFPSGYRFYDEIVPEDASKPYFLISLLVQTYNKRFNRTYSGVLSMDITYDSNQTNIKPDCINIMERLQREFDFAGNYRLKNKTAKITDNVLHFTFDIQYSEVKEEQYTQMQQQTINTKL